MRVAEGRMAQDAAIVQNARQRMDHRGFQRLGRGQRRHDTGQAGGQHGFARPGRTNHCHIVATGRSDFQRAFGALLAFDVFKVCAMFWLMGPLCARL